MPNNTGLRSALCVPLYLALERLDDKVGDDAAVVSRHARAVRVEDAGDAHVDLVLSLVAVRQRFCFSRVVVIRGLGSSVDPMHRRRQATIRTCHTLALVVAGADADRVDVAPVRLVLRVHLRVAVDF